jgi:two-component system NtrC family response regulator
MEPFSPTLYPKHLPDYIRATILDVSTGEQKTAAGNRQSALNSLNKLIPWREYRQKTMHQVEKRYLKDLMQSTGGDILAACEISGLKRARLYQLLKKYRIGKNY